MKFMMFLTFLLSACKGGIWIAGGLILRKHFDAFLSLILHKPAPENLVPESENTEIRKIFDVIGLLLMGIGAIIVLTGFVSWIMSFSIPSGNFKFNY